MTNSGFDWTVYSRSGGEIQKWETVGTAVVGNIVGIRTYEDPKKTSERRKKNPNAGPYIVPLMDIKTEQLDDDGEQIVKTVFVDKVDLTRKVVDAAPQIGDRIRITFTGTEEGGPMKFFNVELKSNGQKHAPAPEPEPEPVEDFSESPF